MKLFTSESVTCGHPDKLCDQISDRILDEYLKVDPNSRVACEVCSHKNGVLVMGEITSKKTIDIESIVRKTTCVALLFMVTFNLYFYEKC